MIGARLSELFERKLKSSENNRWISTVQTYQLHQLLLPRRYLYKTNFYFATLLDNRVDYQLALALPKLAETFKI